MEEIIKELRALSRDLSIDADYRARLTNCTDKLVMKIASGAPEKESSFNLKGVVSNSNGTWPKNLRGSGVMFYNGERITLDDFEREAKRQRLKLKFG